MTKLPDKIIDKQGLLISDNQMAELVETDINQFIQQALSQGFSLYDQFIQQTLAESHPFYDFLLQLQAYALKAQSGQLFFSQPSDFQQVQNRLFEQLHHSELDDELVLFGEFLLWH